jgi:NADPH-dependent 2,4-dienoyl-CoA reductase/sulfur reductase-like enzyme
MRGHRVTLLEQDKRVGGQLLLTSKTPGRDAFEDQVYFQENELARLGVTIRLGTTVDIASVKALRPDAVVVATGSTPRSPKNVPGLTLPHVVTGWDAVRGRAALGGRVAVISQEDHFETPSIALHLAAKGKAVEVFHGSTQLGRDIERYSIGAVMQRLEEADVTIHPNLRLAEITAQAINFVSGYARRPVMVTGFDTVVLVYGSEPNAALYHALRADGTIAQLYIAGAAWTPRGIAEATRDGANVGLVI